MKSSRMIGRNSLVLLGAACWFGLAPGLALSAPGTLPNTPLFLNAAAKPNIMLVIDDSGSMDFEVLFPTNDGALWWSTTSQSFATSGTLNFSAGSQYKTVYLFPNGKGTGDRIYGDSNNHYEIPPFIQYAFARSAAYNKSYYDPDITYRPWGGGGTDTFSDVSPSAAPSDPKVGTSTFNLTANIQSNSTDYTFYLRNGMVIPKGTVYYSSGWKTASSDTAVSSDKAYGIEYYPAEYYIPVTTGTYTVKNGGTTVNGDCSSPAPANYDYFIAQPSDLTAVTGTIDALSYDGKCLQKVTIVNSAANTYSKAATRTDCVTTAGVCTGVEEMQNFANWFSYYRKRHLALRNGIGKAFIGLGGLRTGLLRINHRSNVTMLDMDSNSTSFFDTLYGFGGNSGGTPNREALDYAGKQYERTGTGAPIQGACQQNFAVQFTDGYSVTSTSSGVGNADKPATGASDPYQDNYSNTLADIAYNYYTNLTYSGTKGQVPVPSACNVSSPDPKLDCNTDPHMVTYTVGLGALGTIFGVTHNTVADAYTTTPVWPDVNTSRDPTQIDDLYHAAVDGRGEMYNADTPEKLQNAMQDAISNIVGSIGSASTITFNTSRLETNSALYLALLDSRDWSGDLRAYNIDPVTGDVNATSSWSAADKLDSRSLATNPRLIMTYSGLDGIDFDWTSLTTAQKNDLRTKPDGSTDTDTNAQKRLDFIAGNRGDEGKNVGDLRQRGSRLGDVAHGGSVYVGKPILSWPSTSPFPTASGETYSAFKTTNAAREGVVYVGANDGMLHGFLADGSTNAGQEVLAYIPSTLFSTSATEGLHYLADRGYRHRYFVDMVPSISDAYIKRSSTATSAQWTTVLVGGLRGGGRGLFALDVTNPAGFGTATAADLVLWEFTDADLGYTFSRPTIALMNDGKWRAIFGNGYNDTGSGTAQIFLVDLEGGLDGSWADSGDVIKLDTKVGSAVNPNGMATPAVVDLTGDGVADRIYAGDLQGNLWAFDVSHSNNSQWGSAYGTSATPAPLFKTQTNQPITSAPSVALHHSVATDTSNTAANNEPNLMIYFGTGQYLVNGDLSSTDTQSYYGVWDAGTGNLTSSNLVQQTFVALSAADAANARSLSDNAVAYSESTSPPVYGCYLNLPDSGERVVTNSVVRGDLVYFNSVVPSSAMCSAGGYGWLNSINRDCGNPADIAFDLNGDGIIDSNDKVTTGTGGSTNAAGQKFDGGMPNDPAFLGNNQYTTGTGTDGDNQGVKKRKVKKLTNDNTGRLSWEELVD